MSTTCASGKYLKGLLQWVCHESLIKGQIAISIDDWGLIYKDVPQQSNGVDCGVFVLVCADFLSDDLPLDYSQEEMEHYRQKIATDILRGSLLYPEETLRTKDRRQNRNSNLVTTPMNVCSDDENSDDTQVEAAYVTEDDNHIDDCVAI